MRIVKPMGHRGYEIDSDGNVYSYIKKGSKGKELTDTPIILRGSDSRRGYKKIWIYGKWYYVHRLMAETFIGPIPKGMHVCHKDGNSFNNKLSNLYIGTPSQNMQDTIKHGNQSSKKLNEQKVRFIRKMKGKISRQKLAEMYGVRVAAILNAERGTTWSHVEDGL
jgi:DNA-binding transcriptional regulator YiaG